MSVNIIQAYAPISSSTEEELEKFYTDLKQVTEKLKDRDLTICMGDWNAKVGEGRENKIAGPFGLGIRNDRGDRFVEFCNENNLCIMNTFFKLPKRRLYTWTSPAHLPHQIVRNQIDYITINDRYKNAIKGVKTYPSGDISSDHNVLIADIRLKLKAEKKSQYSGKIDLQDLKENRERFTNILESKLQTDKEVTDIEDNWNQMKSTIQTVLSTAKKGRHKKKKWMTDEILDMMEDRRQYKNSNWEIYRRKNKEIRKKIREAQQLYFEQNCREMEELEKKHDTFNMHKKVREVLNTYTKPSTDLEDKNGKLIITVEDKLKTWEEYILELFNDNRGDIETTATANTGPAINMVELERAIKNSKNRKATGPDNIPAEVIKILENRGKRALLNLFNAIYNTGIIPEDWLKSTFVTIPKKQNARRCNEYRTISLMSHVLKIFLRIIHVRLYGKLEDHMGDTQFGFRNNLGTREALFSLQVLVQKCRDLCHPVYMCFIDFEKAFDKVQHSKLIEVLMKVNIDGKDLRIIRNLYYNQTANVRIGKNVTEEVEIKRGVRQGCLLSPMLFNIYSEFIFKEALEGWNIGVRIEDENGKHIINNLRYADDTVLIANNQQDLQLLMDKVVNSCKEYGLKLNIKKTKYMIVSRKIVRSSSIKVYGTELERTKAITYLGCYVNENWEAEREIRIRIEKARSTFQKMKRVLCSRCLNLNLRMRLVRCYIFSILLYGAECWTLTDTLLKKLQSFEMWVYRRMLRVSWMDKITNIEILNRLDKTTEIVRTIKTRKLEYLGHISRHPEKYGILLIILKGALEGRRGPGRKRKSWIQNLREWYQESNASLFQKVVNKNELANLIANVQ
uniref:Craniofacial development protein 2 n=1 Tax=Cacopsylla melanoneura TaxID=428564 RepID=A0A8D8XFQ8_9HEMI